MPNTLLTLKYETNIACSLAAIPAMRNKINHGLNDRQYLHNHDNSIQGKGATISRYPLVHFRSQNNKLVIMAYNEGIADLQYLVNNNIITKQLGISFIGNYWENDKKNKRNNTCIRQPKFILDAPNKAPKAMADLQNSKANYYRIENAILFKGNTYDAYRNLPNMFAKIAYLENQLAHYIKMAYLSLVDNVDPARYSLLDTLSVSIWDITSINKVPNHHTSNNKTETRVDNTDINFTTMDIEFSVLTWMPQQIALGLEVGYGYGITNAITANKDQ